MPGVRFLPPSARADLPAGRLAGVFVAFLAGRFDVAFFAPFAADRRAAAPPAALRGVFFAAAFRTAGVFFPAAFFAGRRTVFFAAAFFAGLRAVFLAGLRAVFFAADRFAVLFAGDLRAAFPAAFFAGALRAVFFAAVFFAAVFFAAVFFAADFFAADFFAADFFAADFFAADFFAADFFAADFFAADPRADVTRAVFPADRLADFFDVTFFTLFFPTDFLVVLLALPDALADRAGDFFLPAALFTAAAFPAVPFLTVFPLVAFFAGFFFFPAARPAFLAAGGLTVATRAARDAV